MAIPLLLPVGLAVSAVVAFAMGKPKASPVDPKLVKSATDAASNHDWQIAVSASLASRDEKTIRSVARSLVQAGKTLEAKSLLRAGKEQQKPKGKPPTKRARVKAAIAAPTNAIKRAVRKVNPAKPNADPSLLRAQALAKMLADSKRYKENRGAVKSFQLEHSLSPDGLYGAGTARALWNLFKIVPPNPYYWPSHNTNQALASYSAFLDEIVKERPASAGRVAALKKVLGK